MNNKGKDNPEQIHSSTESTGNPERSTSNKHQWTPLMTMVGMFLFVIGMATCLALVGIWQDISTSIAKNNAEIKVLQDKVEHRFDTLLETIFPTTTTNGIHDTGKLRVTYTNDQLIELCTKSDYDSLMKVCSYPDTPEEILTFAVGKIKLAMASTEQDNQFAQEKVTELMMAILSHQNCTREVFTQLVTIKNTEMLPVLTASELNDSVSLTILSQMCAKAYTPVVGYEKDCAVQASLNIIQNDNATEYAIALLWNVVGDEAVREAAATKTPDVEELDRISD